MRVVLKDSARKDLLKIGKGDGKAARRLRTFLHTLETTPDPRRLPNAKKLKGIPNGWRFRVGEYRIETLILKTKGGWDFAEIAEIAEILKDEEFLEVHKIAARQNAYKK